MSYLILTIVTLLSVANSFLWTRKAETICYESVGCYQKSGSFSDQPFPADPNWIQAEFHIYNLASNSGTAEQAHFFKFNATDNFLNIAERDITFPLTGGKKLVFIVHGFKMTVGRPGSYDSELRDALLNLKDGVTVVVVQWSRGAKAYVDPSVDADESDEAMMMVDAGPVGSAPGGMLDAGLNDKQIWNSDFSTMFMSNSTMAINIQNDTSNNDSVVDNSTLNQRAKRASLPYELVDYDEASANTRVVGNLVARFAYQLMAQEAYAPSHLHCIGFSLGGHVCGYAGKYYQKLSGGSKFDRITGLDPAGPIFTDFTDPVTEHLWYTDAKFVDVIHTNTMAFGILRAVGHVDFYAGSHLVYGAAQPGCIGVMTAASREKMARAFGTHSRYWVENKATSTLTLVPDDFLNAMDIIGVDHMVPVTILVDPLGDPHPVEKQIHDILGIRPAKPKATLRYTTSLWPEELKALTHSLNHATTISENDDDSSMMETAGAPDVVIGGLTDVVGCSHKKSWNYYLESILNGPPGEASPCHRSAVLPPLDGTSDCDVFMGYFLTNADVPDDARYKMRLDVGEERPKFCL